MPSTVAIDDEITATLIVTQAAFKKASFCSNSLYQRVEKPAQTVTSFEALKL